MLSKALGSRTVLSGSVTKEKDSNSQSLQMAERPLMSPDELRSIPKGQFIVMKTGAHPMKTRLRLFLDWGITFEDAYTVPERADRRVRYAGCEELERASQEEGIAFLWTMRERNLQRPPWEVWARFSRRRSQTRLSHVKS